jgi:hypothetical protein
MKITFKFFVPSVVHALNGNHFLPPPPSDDNISYEKHRKTYYFRIKSNLECANGIYFFFIRVWFNFHYVFKNCETSDIMIMICTQNFILKDMCQLSVNTFNTFVYLRNYFHLFERCVCIFFRYRQITVSVHTNF